MSDAYKSSYGKLLYQTLHDFDLSADEFRDSSQYVTIGLSSCHLLTVMGTGKFSALLMPSKGGLVIQRHNEIRDACNR